MKKRLFFQLLAFSIAVFVISPAYSIPLEVNSGTFAWTGNGGFEGGGRGQGIYANEDFTVSSIGIFGDLKSELFDIVIYSSINGSDTVSILKTVTELEGGTGNTWNDIAIDFTFDAGNYYVVNWRPNDMGHSDWVNTIDYYDDYALPTNLGPLTLVDGLAGTNAEDPKNVLHPNMRYDITPIPEPATMFLFGTGLVGFLGTRLSKKRNINP